MAPAPSKARSPVFAVALGSLAGALSPIFVALAPGLLAALSLLRSEAAIVALLAVSLPLDTLLTKDIGGFTMRVAHVLALLLAFRILLNTLSRRGAPFRLPPLSLLLPLGIFGVLMTSGIGSTYDPHKSLGYLAWAGFDLTVFAGALFGWVRTPDRALTVTRAFLLGQVLVAFYGFAQVAAYLGAGIQLPGLIQIVNGWPRLHGFHYEPQYYAFYSIQALSMLLVWWLAGFKPFRAIGPGLLLAILAASTFLSLSRSGWLALGLLSLFGFVRPPLRSLKRWGIVFLLAVAVLGGWAAFPSKFRKVLEHMGSAAVNLAEPTSTAPRIESVRYGWQLIHEHPWLGVGVGNYGGSMYEEVWLKKPTEVDRAASWHAVVPANMWIELLAETGVLGTGAFLLFLLALFVRMGRSARRAEPATANVIKGYRLALVMTFLVMYQFAQTLWRLDTWFLIAMCVAVSSFPRATSEKGTYSTER